MDIFHGFLGVLMLNVGKCKKTKHAFEWKHILGVLDITESLGDLSHCFMSKQYAPTCPIQRCLKKKVYE